MTIRTLKTPAVTALVAVALTATGASAQTAAPREKTYGTLGETVISVDAFDFQGMTSADTTGWEPGFNNRFRTGGTNDLMTAGLNIPNGALITSLALTGCDDDANSSLEAHLVTCTLSGGCGVVESVLSPSGQPGCDTYTVTLATPEPVDNAAMTYSTFVRLPATGSTLRFRRVAVTYRLRVSPAPATATFSDVPVGHSLHRFVEALAASGVTGGCGGGAFCPNSPVTRGQMAVFLATALGLHWPN
jgi:hypothetical protein